MINPIVAPLVTNVTLYPNQTNAATNHRNQLTAQFEVLRASTNTELQKLNSVTDGSSGADHIAMTPITEIGTANTVQTIVESHITASDTIVYTGTAAYSDGVFTATTNKVSAYQLNQLYSFFAAPIQATRDLSLVINALTPTPIYKNYFNPATGIFQLVRVGNFIVSQNVIVRYTPNGFIIN